MSYQTIDTLVATNDLRTESVRVSATCNNNSDSLLWVAKDLRITLFGASHDSAEEINAMLASMFGDRKMLEELNQFTNTYSK